MTFNGFETPTERFDARRAILASLPDRLRADYALDRLFDAERRASGDTGLLIDFHAGRGHGVPDLKPGTQKMKHKDPAVLRARDGHGLAILSLAGVPDRVSVSAYGHEMKNADVGRLLEQPELRRVRALDLGGQKISLKKLAAAPVEGLEELRLDYTNVSAAELLNAPLESLRSLAAAGTTMRGADLFALLDRADWALRRVRWWDSEIEPGVLSRLPTARAWSQLEGIDLGMVRCSDAEAFGALLAVVPDTLDEIVFPARQSLRPLERLKRLRSLTAFLGPGPDELPSLPSLRHLNVGVWGKAGLSCLAAWLAAPPPLEALALRVNEGDAALLQDVLARIPRSVRQLEIQLDDDIDWGRFPIDLLLPQGCSPVELRLEVPLDATHVARLVGREELRSVRSLTLGGTLDDEVGRLLGASTPAGLQRLEHRSFRPVGAATLVTSLGDPSCLRGLAFPHGGDARLFEALTRTTSLTALEELRLGSRRPGVTVELSKALWNAPHLANLWIAVKLGSGTGGRGDLPWLKKMAEDPRRRTEGG